MRWPIACPFLIGHKRVRDSNQLKKQKDKILEKTVIFPFSPLSLSPSLSFNFLFLLPPPTLSILLCSTLFLLSLSLALLARASDSTSSRHVYVYGYVQSIFFLVFRFWSCNYWTSQLICDVEIWIVILRSSWILIGFSRVISLRWRYRIQDLWWTTELVACRARPRRRSRS